MEIFNINHSLKDIPIPPMDYYTKCLIARTEEEIQKTTPTEDARQGRNDRLGQDLNPGTNGLTAPAALFGSVLYNPNICKFITIEESINL